MAYGLRVKDAGGTVIIDDVSKINRQRYSHEATASESSSTSLSDISGLLSALISMMINPSDVRNCSHRVSLSGTTLNWSPANVSGITNCATLIGLFIYV